MCIKHIIGKYLLHFLAKFLDEIPSICEHASMHIADGTFRMPTGCRYFMILFCHSLKH